MIGFVGAWLFLSLIAFLLIKVVLKRPSARGKMRLQAVALSLLACLFLAVCGFSTWSMYQWAPVYSESPIVGSDGLEGDTWGRFRGYVSDASRLNREDEGYTVYVEFNSGISVNRGVRWVAGKGLVLELEDGTKLEVPEISYSADYNWNWHDESNYRFLRVGDPITVPGFVYKLSKPSETGATHRIADGEFFYRGTEAEYLQSSLRKWKITEGYAYLTLTVLFGLSLGIGFTGLLTRIKAPSQDGAVADSID